jgi:LuxR family transcriptional regulator, maltose regulon positive regulatory protein
MPFIALLCLRMLGEGYIHIGRLSQAEHTFRQLAVLVEKEWGSSSPLMGAADIGLGEVYRQRNQFDLAEPTLLNSITQCLLWMPAIALDGFIWLVNLYLARGDFTAAQATIQRARQASEGRGYSLLDAWWVLITTVRLDIFRGRFDDALRWVRENGLDPDHPDHLDEFFAQSPGYFRELACCLLARLYLMLGCRENVAGAFENARTVLAYIRPLSEQSGVFTTAMEGLLLSAQVEHALGNPAAAQEALHRALDLAAPERPIRIFLDEGEPVMALLETRRRMELAPVEREYIEALLAAWANEPGGASQPAAAHTPPPANMLTPLSFRELEVLRWIADGKSNQEIAAGLVLSLNTVKRHVSTIMDKLGARNRTEAVMLARQVGLLN